MKTAKRIIVFLMCAALLLGSAGCANNAPPIPAKPKDELTIASDYAVAVPFIAALGLTDRVVAINVKSNFWLAACPSLASAGSVGRGTVDLEALAKYAPDVLIHRSNDPATAQAVTSKLGIPVLPITAENYGGIVNTLNVMGNYFDCESRAQEVTDWLAGKFAEIDAATAQIPADERVTALCLGGQKGAIAGGDMLQSWMIERAGGICAADGIKNNRAWADVGEEKVLSLNPEFIFCTSSTPLNYTVNGLLSDPAWSAVAAIADKNVFVIPAAIDSWDLPGISCPLATMYMLHCMYPAYFSAAQMQAEIDDYYTFMFGRTFDASYLGYSIDK